MKILFLTHYYTPEGNAPATRVSALSERWVKMGHEVTILTCAPNVPNGKVYEGYRNKWITQEEINGVKVIRIWTYIAANKHTIRRILNYTSYMWSAFFHGLFLPKPDIMIATSPQFFCGWAGVLLHWFRRFPFVLEIRDIWPESIASVNAKVPPFLLRIVYWMESAMYRTAMFIVTVGEGYKKKLIQDKRIPENKLAVVMNGVDTEHYYPRPKDETILARYGLNGKFVCSYIGTIGMACGLKTVLDVAVKLKNQGDDTIRFLLVGDGAIREELENEANQKELNNVIFTGRCSKDEIPALLASSDVSLVHLKKTDLFTTVMPSKIFESAGCARPIIIGVEGYAKDFVENAKAGIAVEPENVNDLLDAVLKLKDDPELCQRLGMNCYNNISSKYNRDQQANDYIDILERLKSANKR